MRESALHDSAASGLLQLLHYASFHACRRFKVFQHYLQQLNPDSALSIELECGCTGASIEHGYKSIIIKPSRASAAIVVRLVVIGPPRR